MEAAVVIGANYGDEGKGLITDYLASITNSNTLVIRFNGGAQAGHTVQTPHGLRHVFSHFSSGTFVGAQTYLSHFFIANPILFKQELDKLKSHGFFPKITIHPDAIITTPYDMYINQLSENFKAENRHGSCGVGVSETIERNLHPDFQLTIKDLAGKNSLKKQLFNIKNKWLEARLNKLIHRNLTPNEKDLIFSNDIFDYFLNDIEIFLNNIHIADYDYLTQKSKLIFEGAQGLLLDQNHKNFPHVTRSNTGVQNVAEIAKISNIHHLDIHYISRCYLTRHGAGPLPNEYSSFPCPYFKDETNIPNQFQGALRFAPLNVADLNSQIVTDINKLDKNISSKVTLALTCLDQFEQEIPVIKEKNFITHFKKAEFIDHVITTMDLNNFILSYGPTRNHCHLVN